MTVNFLSRDVEGISKVAYDDSVEKENAHGKGKYPVGRGEGNYAAKASITLFKEEVIAIQRALPAGKRLTDIAPFDMTVEYVYQNMKYRDRIRNCEFTGRSVEVNQNDKTIATEFELIVSHIDWNV